MVLDDIVAERRTHLSTITYGELTPSTRSLEESLTQPGPQLIMECKSASPSLGLIRANYNPRDLALVYSRYAAGISVLCEPKWFHGSYAHLATVASATHLPVLCKDFIVDEVQIKAARYYGADAVLLMLSVLDDDEYAHLSAVATELNLDVLTEVVTEEEAVRANKLGARIVGINHRDLSDMSVDLERSARIAPMLEASVVIGESGIRSVSTIRDMGFLDGFLVGSHLSGAEDVERAVRSLVYGDNKVCGLTKPTDAQVAYAAGATYGGLIRVPESPRYVSRETSIIAAEPRLKYVAVTREEQFADFDATGLTAVQLHSPNTSLDEELALIGRAGATGLEIWRAIDMTAPEGPTLAEAVAEHVDKLVLDTGKGGTGTSFDWSRIPESIKPKSLLAGGIGADIRGALNTNISGLDLNSAVESAPGDKDPARIRAAFQAIKEYS